MSTPARLTALPFTLGIVMLGVVRRAVRHRGGPPGTALGDAGGGPVCFSAGFLISALGVAIGQYWMVILGYGFVGGIGLGIGYISPVSTLIKWFPDRPGMATGIAIMGFGGGAFDRLPVVHLDAHRVSAPPVRTPRPAGSPRPSWCTASSTRAFHVDGLVADPGARRRVGIPPGGTRRPRTSARWRARATSPPRQRDQDAASFWFLWVVLCFNVTAGNRHPGARRPRSTRTSSEAARPAQAVATAAAGFVAILSLANMLGRIIWSSTSERDRPQETPTGCTWGVGALLYLVAGSGGERQQGRLPDLRDAHPVVLRAPGSPTVPAYLAGPVRHLRGSARSTAGLLTAWVVGRRGLGPLIVNFIADRQKAAGLSGPRPCTACRFRIMIGLAGHRIHLQRS